MKLWVVIDGNRIDVQGCVTESTGCPEGVKSDGPYALENAKKPSPPSSTPDW